MLIDHLISSGLGLGLKKSQTLSPLDLLEVFEVVHNVCEGELTFLPSLPGCIAHHCANYTIWWTDVLAPLVICN